MINANLINKIGAFYPIKLSSKDSKHTFYIDYEQLPSQSVVGFYLVLAGMQLHQTFTVHLTITDDTGQVLVDTDNSIDSDSFPEENAVQEMGISTSTFSISPRPFHVKTGTHAYRASVVLKDASGEVWDNASTWFLTRLDPDKAERSTEH